VILILLVILLVVAIAALVAALRGGRQEGPGSAPDQAAQQQQPPAIAAPQGQPGADQPQQGQPYAGVGGQGPQRQVFAPQAHGQGQAGSAPAPQPQPTRQGQIDSAPPQAQSAPPPPAPDGAGQEQTGQAGQIGQVGQTGQTEQAGQARTVRTERVVYSTASNPDSLVAPAPPTASAPLASQAPSTMADESPARGECVVFAPSPSPVVNAGMSREALAGSPASDARVDAPTPPAVPAEGPRHETVIPREDVAPQPQTQPAQAQGQQTPTLTPTSPPQFQTRTASEGASGSVAAPSDTALVGPPRTRTGEVVLAAAPQRLPYRLAELLGEQRQLEEAITLVRRRMEDVEVASDAGSAENRVRLDVLRQDLTQKQERLREILFLQDGYRWLQQRMAPDRALTAGQQAD